MKVYTTYKSRHPEAGKLVSSTVDVTEAYILGLIHTDEHEILKYIPEKIKKDIENIFKNK